VCAGLCQNARRIVLQERARQPGWGELRSAAAAAADTTSAAPGAPPAAKLRRARQLCQRSTTRGPLHPLHPRALGECRSYRLPWEASRARFTTATVTAANCDLLQRRPQIYSQSAQSPQLYCLSAWPGRQPNSYRLHCTAILWAAARLWASALLSGPWTAAFLWTSAPRFFPGWRIPRRDFCPEIEPMWRDR
jgi:hypothetical protein